MKKTYITISTLFILLIAAVLTYISNTPESIAPVYQDKITAENSTTTETIKKPIVAENPEGEANPDIMKLDMKTWNWISTTYNDGKIIKPKNTDKFKLTFKNYESGKTFSASTDCNGVGGEYVLNGNKITFDKMMSTLMYCEGSQEAEFSKSLSEVVSYFFTNKGELVLELKYDSGSMIFR
jgi:heat shock protein HslJ